MPVDLMKAISHAHKILDWFENLTDDDMPPEWMWPFEKELLEWFDLVKERRKHPDEADDREQPAAMMQNDLAKDRRRR